MKLHIESICGAHETTGVPEDAAEEFMGAYEHGDAPVIPVPDGDPEVKHLITRTALYGATLSPDDEPEPEPEPEEPETPAEPEPADPVEAGVAEGEETPEESSTR